MDEGVILRQNEEVFGKQIIRQKADQDGQGLLEGEAQLQELNQPTCYDIYQTQSKYRKDNDVIWIQSLVLIFIFPNSRILLDFQSIFQSKNNINLQLIIMIEKTIRIHNFQRLQKLESGKQAKYEKKFYNPPNAYCKNSMMNKYYAIEKEKGYNYDCKQSKTMKWMKQQFQNKMVKYLGNKTFVKKTTRMEKVHLKEKLNFKNQVNPIIVIFSRLNRKIQHTLRYDGFHAITSI